jgi:DNA-binding MarR family transcriptional regulator
MQQFFSLVNNASWRYYEFMSEEVMQAHDLLERLCNLMRADIRAVCNDYGVQLVQFEALEFLTRCNRYSDTPLSVSEFLGLTKGTVSQTLKALEKKGLLRKQVDASDRRLVHLKPTAKGLQLVERAFPAPALKQGFDQLSKPEGRATVETLRVLLRSVQQANDFKTFAPCKTCRYNKKQNSGYFCELTQESLTVQDVELLCREHAYPETVAMM